MKRKGAGSLRARRLGILILSSQPKGSTPRESDTRPDSAASPGMPELGDMNALRPKSVRREWWQDLDQITIVAVASEKDLPSRDREATRRQVERTKFPEWLKKLLLLYMPGAKNPKTSMCPFAPNASKEQIAKRQDEMLAEIGAPGSVVWAAYWGAPKDDDRIWVTGVRKAEGVLSELYAHIRSEAKFRNENAPFQVLYPSENSAPKPAATTPKNSVQAANAQESPRDQTWQEIHIAFLSDERIQITTQKKHETLNFGEFGFADGRTGKPNSAWATLRTLAQNHGTLTESNNEGQPWAITEKRVQEIRRAFKSRFGLAEDPLPYVKKVGYEARFTIHCAPSFET